MLDCDVRLDSPGEQGLDEVRVKESLVGAERRRAVRRGEVRIWSPIFTLDSFSRRRRPVALE